MRLKSQAESSIDKIGLHRRSDASTIPYLGLLGPPKANYIMPAEFGIHVLGKIESMSPLICVWYL